MKINSIIFALIITTGAFLSGCATEKSRVEMDYGTSYKLAKFNQTLDPDAGKDLEPVEGIDGQTAQKIMEKYHRGFENPAQVMPALTLGTSGGGN